MCMSCDSGKMSTKRKVTIFFSTSIAIAIATYLAFTMTNNPALSAALPALLLFGACPLMCAAVGGLMWFSCHCSTRNDKRKGNHGHNTAIATNTKDEAPWRNHEILKHTNRNQNENLEL